MDQLKIYPLVTLVLVSYNQERYISEAVKSALSQTYENLEIILSDDCSGDKTFEKIEWLVKNYVGPHKIITNRNPINVGLAKHFSDIIAMASGDIIVVAAGDDISLPDRVAKTVKILNDYPEASLVSFSDITIDENGNPYQLLKKNKRKLEKITLNQYLNGNSFSFSGASRGFRRVVADTFKELDKSCPTEDSPYILRGLILGYGLISPEQGIYYRKHSKSLSSPDSLLTMNFENIKKQYISDAMVALDNNLISIETYRKIISWSERNVRRRVFNIYLINNAEFFKSNYKLLFNADYTIREKMRFFKDALKK